MREPRALTQEPLAGVPHRTLRARLWGLIPLCAAVGLLVARAWLFTPPLDRLAPAAAEVGDPPGASARTGSIFVARGGPVIVGFQSEREARLGVAGQEIRGTRLITRRIVVVHGATAIRFAAPPGARLMWSPVGRRGDPEYVPANSLSPEPPDRAVFDRPGTALLDGAIAAGLLAIAVATLAVIARRRLAVVSRATWLAMALAFAAGLAVRWYDLGAAGQTWDEDVYWATGRNDVTNLVGLDVRAASWQWNFEHPPVTKLLDGIGAEIADGYGPARALSAIWMALGCALLVPIGARLFRLRVGALAAVIAALLPPLVAHGQIVGHESPSVLGWALGVLLALGAHDYLPADDRRAVRVLRTRLAWIGVAIGIAAGVRVTNGLLGPLCALIVAVQAPPRWRRETLVWGAWLMPVTALATFYAAWPRLWLHPFASLAESFRKFAGAPGAEPFLGAMTAHPGLHYFAVYLAATLPLGIAIGAALGAVRLVRARIAARARSRRPPTSSERDLGGRRRATSAGSAGGGHHAPGQAPWTGWILVAWLILPLGVLASPLRRDGVRYVLPCLLALSLLAAAGFDQLAVWARLRHAFLAIALAVVGYLAVTLARVHPYYLDYFAEQVGGAGRVAERGWFETAWWGEGLDRAVDYVNAHAAAGARVDRACIEPAHLAWFREDLWPAMTSTARDADWIVSYAPSTHPCPVPPEAHPVFSVTSDGAVLAVVYERSPAVQ